MSVKDSDTAFRCEFQNVDTVNGGEYEVHASGEESPWAIEGKAYPTLFRVSMEEMAATTYPGVP